MMSARTWYNSAEAYDIDSSPFPALQALHELQRLQAACRTEGDVLPPIALDVDVSGVPGEGL